MKNMRSARMLSSDEARRTTQGSAIKKGRGARALWIGGRLTAIGCRIMTNRPFSRLEHFLQLVACFRKSVIIEGVEMALHVGDLSEYVVIPR